jgi:serine/threonine protein kinase
MDEDSSELVVAAKLETEFLLGCVKHRFRDPASASITREEIWDIRDEIGRGGSGVVRKEERRISPPEEPQLRAVKQMRKGQPSHGSTWTYRDELAAVVKFSQPQVCSLPKPAAVFALTYRQFSPHFVDLLGWFENDESIFIAMEYLPAGDLEHFKNASPPFSEQDTNRITRQLVEGVRHMHENGFTHRDLKPGVRTSLSSTPRPD